MRDAERFGADVDPRMLSPAGVRACVSASAGLAGARLTESIMSHSPMSEILAAAFADEPSMDVSTALQRWAKTSSRSEISKAETVLKKLRLARGVTVLQIMELTGWQSHSVRGFFSAVVRKRLKLNLVSEVGKDGQRRYRIVDDAAKATD